MADSPKRFCASLWRTEYFEGLHGADGKAEGADRHRFGRAKLSRITAAVLVRRGGGGCHSSVFEWPCLVRDGSALEHRGNLGGCAGRHSCMCGARARRNRVDRRRWMGGRLRSNARKRLSRSESVLL